MTSASISRTTIITLLGLYPFFSIILYKGYFLLSLCGFLLVLFVDLLIKKGKLWLDVRPKAVYVFFLIPLVSVLWAKYPTVTLWNGALVLVNILIFYLSSRANADAKHLLISRIVIVVPIVILVVYTVIFAKFGSVRPVDVAMADSVGSVSNSLSAVVVLCLPYLFALLKINKRKLLIYMVIVACVISIILSQSRSAYLLLLVTIFLSLCLFVNWRRYYFSGLFAISVSLLFFVVSLLLTSELELRNWPVLARFGDSQIVDNLYTHNFEPEKGKPDYVRSVMYVTGVKIILEDPLVGVGYGGLSRIIQEEYGFPAISHNLLITVWGELGLIGLLCFIWLSTVIVMRVYTGLRSNSLTSEDRYIVYATGIALACAFISAQFRPNLLNPMIPILLAQLYARGGRVRCDYGKVFNSRVLTK